MENSEKWLRTSAPSGLLINERSAQILEFIKLPVFGDGCRCRLRGNLWKIDKQQQ